MIEPKEPVTIHVRHSDTPAFLLPGDQDIRVTPSTIVLRHRHFVKQFTIISRPSVTVEAEDAPKRKATRGHHVAFVSSIQRQAEPDQTTASNIDKPGEAGDRVRPATTRRSSSIAPPPLDGGDQAVPPISVTTSVQVQPQQPRPPTIYASNANPATGTGSTSTARGAEGLAKTASKSPTKTSLVVTQHSHAIRDRDEKTVWYASKGADLLSSPVIPSATKPQDGYLYVHTASGDRRQLWMWKNGKWIVVDLYYPHPSLTGYVLNLLSNGEPSWVTSETVRTYKGRAKKRGLGNMAKEKASTS